MVSTRDSRSQVYIDLPPSSPILLLYERLMLVIERFIRSAVPIASAPASPILLPVRSIEVADRFTCSPLPTPHYWHNVISLSEQHCCSNPTFYDLVVWGNTPVPVNQTHLIKRKKRGIKRRNSMVWQGFVPMANSSNSAMRPPCYYLLEEIVILGVIYGSLVWRVCNPAAPAGPRGIPGPSPGSYRWPCFPRRILCCTRG